MEYLCAKTTFNKKLKFLKMYRDNFIETCERKMLNMEPQGWQGQGTVVTMHLVSVLFSNSEMLVTHLFSFSFQ